MTPMKISTFITLLILLLCLPDLVTAREEPFGFLLDENGQVRQINVLTKGKFTAGRGFPYYQEPVALSVTVPETGKRIARINMKNKQWSWFHYHALPHPLDAHRLIIDIHEWSQKNGDHSAVWDLRDNSLRILRGTGSNSSESVSDIRLDEQAVLSSSQGPDGVVLHDLRNATRARFYEGYKAFSPRFSPDGTRWAFIGSREGRYDLIIHWTNQNRERVIPLSSRASSLSYSFLLAWSPSGARIVSVLHTGELVVWDSEGNLVQRFHLPFEASGEWPPLWSKDEKGVFILPKPDYKGIPYRYKNPIKPKFVPVGSDCKRGNVDLNQAVGPS